MSVEYQMKLQESMSFLCHDGNGVPIYVTKEEIKAMEEKRRFTIDEKDTLYGATQNDHLQKVSIMGRCYWVELAKRIMKHKGLKVVYLRDVKKALRCSKLDLERSYNYAVEHIYNNDKVVMDEHRYNGELVQHSQKCMRKLDIQRKTIGNNHKELFLVNLRTLNEKKRLAMRMSCYRESSTKAKAVKMQLIGRLQEDLKEQGIRVPNQREALEFIVNARYHYKKAFSSAKRVMSVAVNHK